MVYNNVENALELPPVSMITALCEAPKLRSSGVVPWTWTILATQSLLRGLVRPDYLPGIQLIFRLDHRQLALFFGVPQNLAVRQHIHCALVYIFFDCGFDQCIS